MEQEGKPHDTIELECPVLKKREEVGFDVNIFHAIEHGGLDVTACSEFLHGAGKVTCGKACIHTPEARALHEKELREHQGQLAKIGPNVLG